MQFRMIEGRLGLHFVLRKSCRLGSSIGVECGSLNTPASRPKTRAAHFARVGLSRNWISAGTRWSDTAAEAGHSEIKASPKELNRAGLADEPCAKLFEHDVAPHQDPPETVNRISIVGGVDVVCLEWNGIGKFVGYGVDVHLDSQFA